MLRSNECCNNEGISETDTRSKALSNDDFDIYGPPCMLGVDECLYNVEKHPVDGMLESIVNQAIVSNPCAFDTQVPQDTQEDDDHYINIHGCQYSTRVVPTADSSNTIDAFVASCNSTYSSADPSETNLEEIFHIGTWVADVSEEQLSKLVIQEENQKLSQGYGQVVSDQAVVPRESGKLLSQGYAEMIVPETDIDQVVVLEKHDEMVLPQGYAKEKNVFTGDSEESCQRAAFQTRTSDTPTSRKLSKKEKGKKEAASRKHNKSEQTRRELINQKMKTLHAMVPFRSKEASKAIMLTEVIHYVKQLQAQVKAMKSMRNTEPRVIMGYPMASNMLQASSMYSTMVHPQRINTTMQEQSQNRT